MPLFGTTKNFNYSYTPIADYFIALSNETGSLISNLKLQKLVYYAQAWYLANYKEELIKEDFQAWVHGPVIPTLYSEYKKFGWQPILRTDLDDKSLIEIKSNLPTKTNLLLDLIVDGYFGLSAFELERLTHSEDPWVQTRGAIPEDAPSDSIIDKNLIRDYYTRFIADVPENK